MNKEKAKKIQKTYQIVRYVLIATILIVLGVASAKAEETTMTELSADTEQAPSTLRQAQDKRSSGQAKSAPTDAKENEPWYKKGKPIVTIFGDFSGKFQEGSKPQWGFNLDRAYLGYQQQFNDNWSAKIVFDMGKGSDEKLERVAYLKNAEIDYNKDGFSVNLGLTSTAIFNVQEKFWGLRYIYKSFMDDRGWQSSADLGFKAAYQFCNWFSADLSAYNGEGYKKLQSDNHFQYGLGMTFTPVKGLTLRAYGDVKTAEDAVGQGNVALFAGYKAKNFRVGAEYNMEFNNANVNGNNLTGVSVYAVGKVTKKAEVFARYDYGDSKGDNDWKYSKDGHTSIVGMSYDVNKIFSIAPNVRLTNKEGEKPLIGAYISGKVNL